MKQGDYGEAVRWLEGSREYPERLGSGKPDNPDYRVQDYLLMVCYENMGSLSEADQARERIYAFSSRRAKENAEVISRKVDLWRSHDLQQKSEIEALQVLYQLVAGDRRRRE